ncbi:MAG TPA: hypothetical protein VKX28_10500 [Xanthobacteraceae bacterium]|nr:hypothetical protein [Xanthobacteraceae bacterium]
MKDLSFPFSPGEWFDAEQVHAMGAAFDRACASLDLSEADGGVAALVAQKVIDAAESGERDAARLYEIVMHWAHAA